MMIKRIRVILSVIAYIFAFAIFTNTAFASEANKSLQKATASFEPVVSAKQSEINYLDVTIQVENIQEMIQTAFADEMKVTGNMYYNGEVRRSSSETFKLRADKAEYEMPFSDFGKYTTTIEFYSKGAKVYEVTQIVGVVAEEYNFAALNASFPVVYFTLSLPEITVNEDKPVPTFVILERTKSYDWDKLPQNVYTLPLAHEYEVTTGDNFHPLRKVMAEYIKDLYELNPDSKFNLYTVDNYPEHVLDMLVANQIPESNYTVHLLSDGDGSYYYFNQHFGGANARELYSEMVDIWKELKEKVRKEGYFDHAWVTKYGSGNKYSVLAKYAYIIANEEANVDWWLARVSDTFIGEDMDFMNDVKQSECIKVVGIANLLSNLTEEQTEQIKLLYRFSDDMFSKANELGKKVMIILGARVTGEVDFEDYAKFVQTYYGDEYVYYYKGHPGTPTGLYPEKQEQLNRLGMIDIESSIPAELIFLFNPDVYLSGYQTSAFLSVSEDAMACALFNAPKTVEQVYAPKMDVFITRIKEDSEYYKYCVKGNRSYLVEYNSKDEVSIYDATENVVRDPEAVMPTVTPTVEPTATPAPTAQPSQEPITVNKVTGLTVKSTTNNSVTITWDRMEEADGYVIAYKQNGNWTSKELTENEWMHSSLKSATTIAYKVKAFQVVNGTKVYGEYTNLVKTTTTLDKITSVTVKPSNTSIHVSWKKENDVSGYQVVIYKGNKVVKRVEVSGKATSSTIKGLSANTTYRIEVRGYRSVEGIRYYGESSKAVITSTKAKATTVTLKGATKKAAVSWKKVSGAAGYEVVMSTKKTSGFKKVATVKATTTKQTIKNLKSGSTYYFKVRSYKTVDGKKIYSDYSKVKSVKVKY